MGDIDDRQFTLLQKMGSCTSRYKSAQASWDVFNKKLLEMWERFCCDPSSPHPGEEDLLGHAWYRFATPFRQSVVRLLHNDTLVELCVEPLEAASMTLAFVLLGFILQDTQQEEINIFVDKVLVHRLRLYKDVPVPVLDTSFLPVWPILTSRVQVVVPSHARILLVTAVLKREKMEKLIKEYHCVPYYLPIAGRCCRVDLSSVGWVPPLAPATGVIFPEVPYHESLLKSKAIENTRRFERELVEKAWHPLRLGSCLDLDDSHLL